MSEAPQLKLHDWLARHGARFEFVRGLEVVADFGAVDAEYRALRETVGVLDLSFRGRLGLTGADRVRFLHGQVTSDVKRLRPGAGGYAALTTAKGKIQSDLNIYCLAEELLLDFEPGLTRIVVERLEKYLVADDVQVVEVAPHYGLLSVQGPQAETWLRTGAGFADLPQPPVVIAPLVTESWGELYAARQARFGTTGFDLFIPLNALESVAESLQAALPAGGGHWCGWTAAERARLAAGIPRFGADMDDTHLASECGIEARAISYQKGCYIGQEVLNRIHSIGHVNQELRPLRFAASSQPLPPVGAKLFHGEQPVGYITSIAQAPDVGGVALGYVRREFLAAGNELQLRGPAGVIPVTVG